MLEYDKTNNEYAIATVRTFDPKFEEYRNVSLFYSVTSKDITLLGVLPHGTRIIIDQSLVDDLQELVNLQKEK